MYHGVFVMRYLPHHSGSLVDSGREEATESGWVERLCFEVLDADCSIRKTMPRDGYLPGGRRMLMMKLRGGVKCTDPHPPPPKT